MPATSGNVPPRSGQPAQPSVSAWGLFFAFGLLLAAHGLYLVVLPSAEPDHWRSYTSDPDVVSYLGDEFRATGGLEVAFGVLAMLVALVWFRAGHPWAWRAFWVFPALFAWGMLTTWAVLLWLALLVASVAGLAGTYRRFFPSPRTAD